MRAGRSPCLTPEEPALRPQPDRSRLSLRLSSTETEPPAESGAAVAWSGGRSRRVRRRVFTVEWLEGRTLLSGAPTVATGAASSILAGQATLNATVNPNGSSTTALFQYSTSPTFTPTVQTNIAANFGDLPYFDAPAGVAVDAAGNIYVADQGDNQVDQISPSGTFSVIGSGFNQPSGVAVDAYGDVFVADRGSSTVKEVLPNNTVITIGSGSFNAPYGVALDSAGDLFVADSGNNVIKEVVPTDGQGNFSSGYTINTIATGFNSPRGVAVDAAGDVYVADYNNNAIDELLTNNNMITLTTAIVNPRNLAVDAAGDVYVADAATDAVYEVLPNETVDTFVSPLNSPRGVALDAAGDVFIASTGPDPVLEVSPMSVAATPSPLTGTTATAVSAALTGLKRDTTYYDRVVATNAYGTVVDTATGSFTTPQGTPTVALGAVSSVTTTEATLNATVNANGYSTSAYFQYSTSPAFTPIVATTIGSGLSEPYSVAVDPAGNVYVSDTGASEVEEILPNLTVKTIGSGFSYQGGIAVDAAGDVFVADGVYNEVEEVLRDGSMKTIGSGFNNPSSVAVDSAGNVYVADYGSASVKEVLANGTVVTLGTGYTSVSGIAVDAAGDVFVTDASPFVTEILPGGSTKSIGSGFTYPAGVAVDHEGDVFVGDHGNSAVKEVLPNGTILTLDPAAGFSFPDGVAVDSVGDVFVADTGNNRIVFLQSQAPSTAVFFFTGTTATAFSVQLTGLTPGTTYYDRVGAFNQYGTVGDSSSFTTTPVITTTTTTLTSSSNPAFPGQPLTFTAVVAPVTPGLPTPTGSVTFYDNGTALDSSPIPLDGTGTAVFTTSSLALGTHPITAVYSGDPYNVTSTSSTLNESVASVISTMTTLTSSAGTVYAGQPLTFTAVVAPVSPGGPTRRPCDVLRQRCPDQRPARPPRCHGHRRLHHIVALGGNEPDHRVLPGRPVPRGVLLVAVE